MARDIQKKARKLMMDDVKPVRRSLNSKKDSGNVDPDEEDFDKPAKKTLANRPMKSAKVFEIELDFSKETPGTYVYATTDKKAVVTTLYIKKAAYKTPPKSVTITIED